MSEEKVIVPEHYKLLADEFKPLIKEIQDAFINRPVPEGQPYSELQDIVSTLMDRTVSAINKLSDAMNNIPGCMSLTDGNIAADEIIRAASNVRLKIREIISIFHDIWKRPFPLGLADGQLPDQPDVDFRG